MDKFIGMVMKKLYVRDSLHRKLKQCAKDNGRTIQEETEIALKAHLLSQKPEDRPDYIPPLRAKYTEYRDKVTV